MALAMIAVAVPACSAPIDGRPVMGPKNGDPASFFAGDVAVYGQRVSAESLARLSYLRALRRIDVCGLLAGNALAKVGELVSVGTLLAFNECDAEVKVSGAGARQFISVSVEISTPEPSLCDVLVPLSLSGLPGAPQPPAGVQPTLRVESIAEADCALTRRIADALTARMAAAPLPPRDTAATYPSRLAERDPCEVLSVLDGVTAWDVGGSGPYACQFSVRNGVDLQVRLQPQFVDAGATDCSAVSFVGPAMQRRVMGVGYVYPADVVIRPAVVVEDVDGRDCEAITDVAAKAATLYG